MPTPAPDRSSSALNALTAEERSSVLAALLSADPGLIDHAEGEAHRLLTSVTIDEVADDVAWALRMIPLENLGARAGRVPGRGYVHEPEAAWELVQEAVEPYLADMRRRSSLGLQEPAAVVAAGIVAGLYEVDGPEGGTVLAYAGPDVPSELADQALTEAGGLGLLIPEDAPARYWPRWTDRE